MLSLPKRGAEEEGGSSDHRPIRAREMVELFVWKEEAAATTPRTDSCNPW